MSIEKIWRKSGVCARLGVSKSTLERLIKTENFPQPVKLGTRAVGFLESEIEEWIEARTAARDEGKSSPQQFMASK